MRKACAWVAVNALLVGTQIVGAATSWAGGTLLLMTPAAGEWWAWMLVGVAAVAAAIAFLFWVTAGARTRKFARR